MHVKVPPIPQRPKVRLEARRIEAFVKLHGEDVGPSLWEQEQRDAFHRELEPE